MSLLLDTQALLWFVLDDSRLSETARESVVSSDELFARYGVERIW